MRPPEVRAYLKKVFARVLDEWGFDLVKLDFLYAAAPHGSASETRAGRMRRAMAFLRELCGDKLILGCGVPLMPAFGLVDYCRVGCDMTLDWDNNLVMRRTNRERPSTRLSIADTIFRRELSGRAFLSDPDVFFLRDDNIKLTEEQKQTLATVNARTTWGATIWKNARSTAACWRRAAPKGSASTPTRRGSSPSPMSSTACTSL